MIIKTINEDIFTTEAKHIVFAASTEGYNNTVLALKIDEKIRKDKKYRRTINIVEDYVTRELGTVYSQTIGDKTYHGLVCYSYKDGWGKNQGDILRTCLDKLEINGELIAINDIGEDEYLSSASFSELLCGMEESKQNILLYTEWYNEEEIKRLYATTKARKQLEKEQQELKEKLGINEFLNRKTKYEIIKDIITELGVCELESYIRNTGFGDVGQHNINVRREEILNYLDEMNNVWNEHNVDMTDRQSMMVIKKEIKPE